MRRDASSVLTLFVVLAVLLPANLVIAPLGGSGTPANVVGLCALLWWANARLVPSIGIALGMQPMRIAILLFSWSIVLAYLAASTLPRALNERLAADRGLFDLAAWCGVALLAADGIRDNSRLAVLLRRLVFASAALAALGILQFAAGVDLASLVDVPGLTANHDLSYIGSRSIFRRVAGTANHPIEFSVVLAVALPLAMHFALSAGRRWTDMVSLALIASAIPMAVSRSGILGAGVASAVMFLGWNGRQRLTALLVTPVFLVALRMLVPGLLGTVRSLFENLWADPSVTGRTDDYAQVAEFVRGRLMLGRGFRTFLPDVYITFDNQYLLQVVEVGMVGLVALVLLIGTGVACARGARRRAADAESRSLAQAITASLVAVGATFATFDGLSFPMISSVTFLILGSAGALWRNSAGEVTLAGLVAADGALAEGSSGQPSAGRASLA